jgi:6-phosphofructokinase 2
MATILTLTFNPAIDVSTSVERVEPIHKLRCGPVERDPGGGGINVARVVRRLGSDVVAVYPTGGLIGAFLRKLTDEEGVQSRTVAIAGETREDFTVLEKASGEQYRFVLPGPELTEAEWRACLDIPLHYDEELAFIVASGSLPPGVPAEVLVSLSRAARDKSAKLIVDGTRPVLEAALKEGCHLIKPNLREMRDLTGEPLASRGEWIDSSRRLVETRKVEAVALTLGDQGALLVTREEAWFAHGLPVKRVSSVGAGDSFLGACVWALSRGHPHKEALRHGVAAGSAALLRPATDLCRKADMERLLPHVKVEAV